MIPNFFLPLETATQTNPPKRIQFKVLPEGVKRMIKLPIATISNITFRIKQNLKNIVNFYSWNFYFSKMDRQ